MHYDAITGNTADPGRFVTVTQHRATQTRPSATPAAILIPPRARPLTLTLPSAPTAGTA
jgi:hypothetical protein